MTTKTTWLALLGLAVVTPALAGGPEGGAGGRPPFRMPPQEAQAACAKLALGATCSFTFDGRAHTGTCRRGPEGEGPIACAPQRGPGGGAAGEPGKGGEQPRP